MSKQFLIQEARAKKDSALLLSEAEVIRAEGIEKANKIIGHSLQGNESYLRYLWIDGMQHINNQLVYVPTEAGFPILEASRKGG